MELRYSLTAFLMENLRTGKIKPRKQVFVLFVVEVTRSLVGFVSHPCQIKHKTFFSKLSPIDFLIEGTSTVIMKKKIIQISQKLTKK